jgi:hypothetical protein
VILGPGPAILYELGMPGRIQMEKMLWQTTPISSNSQHTHLREFNTNMPFRELSTLRQLFNKFPNLEQLDIRNVSGIDSMNAFLPLISSKLPQLKRLFWGFEDKYLNLHQLFEHIVQVPSLLPKLDYYFLKQCKILSKNQQEWMR